MLFINFYILEDTNYNPIGEVLQGCIIFGQDIVSYKGLYGDSYQRVYELDHRPARMVKFL